MKTQTRPAKRPKTPMPGAPTPQPMVAALRPTATIDSSVSAVTARRSQRADRRVAASASSASARVAGGNALAVGRGQLAAARPRTAPRRSAPRRPRRHRSSARCCAARPPGRRRNRTASARRGRSRPGGVELRRVACATRRAAAAQSSPPLAYSTAREELTMIGPSAPPAGAHGGLGVAALGADAGDQQRQRRREFAHARDLGRVGGADDQAELAAAVPVARPPAGRCVRTAARRRRGSAPAGRRRRGWRCGTAGSGRGRRSAG